MKNFPQKICFFIAAFLAFLSSNVHLAAAQTVIFTGTTSASAIPDNDTVSFAGAGTLDIDVAKPLGTISTAITGIGTINFSSANQLTVSGNIGDVSLGLDNINFAADGTLDFTGNLYAGSINTAIDLQGSLIASGALTQTISAAIGSSLLQLKTFNINQTSGVTIEQAVYADNFLTKTDTANLAITNNSSLNFNTSTINTQITLSGTGTNSFGDLTLANGKTINLSSNLNINNFTSGDTSSIININGGNSVSVGENISGTGLMKGVSDGVGDVIFNGVAAQTVSSNYQLGNSTNRLGALTVNNTNTTGVTFNNDAYFSSIAFGQASGTAKLNIVSGKIIDLTGNVSVGSGAADSYVSGAGILNLSGSSPQTIDANIGTDISSRLTELRINNAGNIALNGNVFVGIINSNVVGTTISVNKLLNASTLNVNQNLTLTGAGGISLTALIVAADKILSIDSNASLTAIFSANTNSTISIGSGKTLSISGDIDDSQLGLMRGVSNGVGNISFVGSAAQNVGVGYQLGNSSNRLGSLSIANNSGAISLKNDAYFSDVVFNQASSSASLNIASTKTLDVSGDISASSSGDGSTILGAGTINLSGSTTQTISASLGSSVSNRLDSLIINNSSGGVVLEADNFLNSLNISNGSLTIGGQTTADVSNSVDLSAKTLNISATSGSNPFGLLKSGGSITVNDQTKIGFDYQDSLSLPQMGTAYKIAESTSGIIGDVDQISVSDNSLLFKNILELSADSNSINTVLRIDEASFNQQNLGSRAYNLLISSLDTSLATGILGVADDKELKELTDNLAPMNNAAQISSINSLNTNLLKSTGFADGRLIQKIGQKSIIWAKAFGNYLRQNSRENKQEKVFGYKENGGGMIFGFENEVAKKMKLGAAFGYARSNILGDTKYKNQIDINSYQLALFNKNGDDASGFYNHNSMAITLNKTKTQRRIVAGTFDQNSSGSFSGNSQAARVAFGYSAQGKKWFIDPNLAVQYFRISGSSYQETGADDVSLKVKNKALSGYLFDLGLDFGYRTDFEYEDGTNFNLLPKLSLGMIRTAKSYQQDSKVAFVNQGNWIDNSSIAMQQNIFRVGAGLKIDTGSDDNFLNLQFDLRAAQRMFGTNYSANYVYRF